MEDKPAAGWEERNEEGQGPGQRKLDAQFSLDLLWALHGWREADGKWRVE